MRLIAILICFCGLLAAQAPPLAVVDEPLPPLVAGRGIPRSSSCHAAAFRPTFGAWPAAIFPKESRSRRKACLAGRPTKPGAFALTLRVEDSGHPAHTINKEFRGVVTASLLIEWLQPPKVRDNRIDGIVQVSNGSTETFDLTIIIVAVADNGRATAIGYQHFPLKAGHYRLSNSLWQHAPPWRLRDPCRCHCRNPRPESHPSPETPDALNLCRSCRVRSGFCPRGKQEEVRKSLALSVLSHFLCLS